MNRHTAMLCSLLVEPEKSTSLIYLLSVRSAETHRTFRFWFTAYPSKKSVLAVLARRISAMATRLEEPDCPSDQQEALADVEQVEARVKAKWPKLPPKTYGYHFAMPKDSMLEVFLTAVHAFTVEEK